jgi:hypothetical protein
VRRKRIFSVVDSDSQRERQQGTYEGVAVSLSHPARASQGRAAALLASAAPARRQLSTRYRVTDQRLVGIFGRGERQRGSLIRRQDEPERANETERSIGSRAHRLWWCSGGSRGKDGKPRGQWWGSRLRNFGGSLDGGRSSSSSSTGVQHR